MTRSILQKERECYFSHRTDNLDVHHVMNGAFRGKSDRYGLWVYLHHDVHMYLHQTSSGQQMAKELKKKAQEAFEEKYGHEKWMQEFHKNYL